MAFEAGRAGANLTEANLEGVNLYEADLRGANLRGANVRMALLRRANLRWTNLYRANLYRANLKNADLRGYHKPQRRLNFDYDDDAELAITYMIAANLEGSDLTGAKYNDQTKWPEGFDPEKAGAIHVD